MTAQKILIDTSILLEGGEEVIAKLSKVAPVFVTDIVLQELDGHKNNANTSVAYRAREFFRRLGSSNGEALFTLPPDGMKLEKTDSLRKMRLGDTPLYVLIRKPYKSRDINDSKIIEVAKDYNMTLVTLDTAQRVRGLSDGVEAVTLASILPVESFKKEVNEMNEVEQVDEKQDVKKTFSLPLLFVGIALIIVSLIFSSSVWSYILFFVGLGIIASMTNKKPSKPVRKTIVTQSEAQYISSDSAIVQLQKKVEIENQEKERTRKPFFSFGWENPKKDSFETFTDPLYSNLLGNSHHKS